MSKLEVNAVEPQCGTNLTLGASGDTIIIPSGATISNQGTAAGFGPTGAVSWNTTKITADPNPAVSGVGYFADTTSAAFTITLPSSPSAGAVVGIADYANTFATNNLTVDRNGSNIGGVAANADLSTNGVSITFVYVDATQGWIVTDSGNRSDLPAPEYVTATGGTITCDGDFKVHTFTGPGTFTVTSAGNPFGSDTVDYLVVAGGGGSGTFRGGGGGAGGLRTASSFPILVQPYPIAVGGGGVAGVAFTSAGGNGVDSVFSTITSTGGGGGGDAGPAAPAPQRVGQNGGSGGGGAALGGLAGGTGNTPPVSPPQGNSGGTSTPSPSGRAGGGGGGASAIGTDGAGTSTPTNVGGNGGAGTDVTPIFGPGLPNSGVYAGGGGGGSGCGATGTGGTGGTGGGGPGSGNSSIGGTAGTANTGGGAGGAGDACTSAAGGSGIVIIRYKFQN
jgi:hypothetical protein